MSLIEIKDLTKKYNSTVALNNVNLILEKNKIYGLLGRNGAGKTTLLNLMTNKIFPTTGGVLIDNQNVIENDVVLGKIYGMTEKNLYPDSMKISTIFKWTKEFYPNFNMDYAMKLADKFTLDINKKVKELSTGYSSIFKIIVALASNAEIILLDEPVLGLDANHRDMFYKELLLNYSDYPRTIVISTHLIEECADIIEEAIILKEGEVLLHENVEQLLAKSFTVSGIASVVDEFIKDKNVLAVESLGGLKTAYLLSERTSSSLPPGLEITKLDLQKLFIYLTNNSGRIN